MKNISYKTCRYVYDVPFTKFHLPGPNSLLLIPIKLKAKYRFCMASMLFYILHMYDLCTLRSRMLNFTNFHILLEVTIFEFYIFFVP